MLSFCFVFLFLGTEAGPQVSQERSPYSLEDISVKQRWLLFSTATFFFSHLHFPQSQLHIAKDCAHLWGMGICVRQARDQFCFLQLTRHLSSGKATWSFWTWEFYLQDTGRNIAWNYSKEPECSCSLTSRLGNYHFTCIFSP